MKRIGLCLFIFVFSGLNAGEVSKVGFTRVKEDKGTKDVPLQINYQGYLVSAGDTSAVNGTFEMTFRIFPTQTEGSELWSETQNDVQVDNGVFSVNLGSVTPIPAGIFTGVPLWLQTEVGTEVLLPRKKLVSVGYGIKSLKADTANYAITTGATNYADSSGVTAYSWDGFHSVYSDTSQWTLGGGGVGYADTAGYALSIADNTVNSDKVEDHTLKRVDVVTTFKAPYADTADYATASPGDNDWIISGVDMYSAVSGNVGIGTTAPGYNLDVSGNGRFTDNLTVNNTVYVSESSVYSGTPISSEVSTTSTTFVPLTLFYIYDQNTDRIVTVYVKISAKGASSGETVVVCVRGINYGTGTNTDLNDYQTTAPMLGVWHIRSNIYTNYEMTLGPFAVKDNNKWIFFINFRTRNASYPAYVNSVSYEIRDMKINF